MELHCLEDFWPSADGLSAVNVIGTKLRDPINTGLTRWRMVVYINRRRLPRASTRFSLSAWRMSRLTQDGTAKLVSRDQMLRRERGQGNIHSLCSADHEQVWQSYPVDPYSDDFTYILYLYILQQYRYICIICTINTAVEPIQVLSVHSYHDTVLRTEQYCIKFPIGVL